MQRSTPSHSGDQSSLLDMGSLGATGPMHLAQVGPGGWAVPPGACPSGPSSDKDSSLGLAGGCYQQSAPCPDFGGAWARVPAGRHVGGSGVFVLSRGRPGATGGRPSPGLLRSLHRQGRPAAGVGTAPDQALLHAGGAAGSPAATAAAAGLSGYEHDSIRVSRTAGKLEVQLPGPGARAPVTRGALCRTSILDTALCQQLVGAMQLPTFEQASADELAFLSAGLSAVQLLALNSPGQELLDAALQRLRALLSPATQSCQVRMPGWQHP